MPLVVRLASAVLPGAAFAVGPAVRTTAVVAVPAPAAASATEGEAQQAEEDEQEDQEAEEAEEDVAEAPSPGPAGIRRDAIGARGDDDVPAFGDGLGGDAVSHTGVVGDGADPDRAEHEDDDEEDSGDRSRVHEWAVLL